MLSRSGSLRSPSDDSTQHLAACDTYPSAPVRYHTLHHSDTIPTTATRHSSGLRGEIALAVISLALLQPLVLVGLLPHTPLRYAEIALAVISLTLLQPLVLVGLLPHTPLEYAANHTSRLFRLRSCNRSCSWGYRPTPR